MTGERTLRQASCPFCAERTTLDEPVTVTKGESVALDCEGCYGINQVRFRNVSPQGFGVDPRDITVSPVFFEDTHMLFYVSQLVDEP